MNYLYELQKLLNLIDKGKNNYDIAEEFGCQPSKISKLKKQAYELGMLSKSGCKFVVNSLGYLILTEMYDYGLLGKTTECLLNNYPLSQDNETMVVALSVWKLSEEARYSTVSVKNIYKDTGLRGYKITSALKKLEAAECYSYANIADLHNAGLSSSISLQTIVDRISKFLAYQ